MLRIRKIKQRRGWREIGEGVILARVVREGFWEEVTFKQSPE